MVHNSSTRTSIDAPPYGESEPKPYERGAALPDVIVRVKVCPFSPIFNTGTINSPSVTLVKTWYYCSNAVRWRPALAGWSV